jgi:hypothetical protein
MALRGHSNDELTLQFTTKQPSDAGAGPLSWPVRSLDKSSREVTDDVRHASLLTTSVYLHFMADEREEVEALFAGAE